MSCITEILKLKGDKEFFVPDGDWIAVEGGGVYKDYEYLIVLNSHGFRCGYVAIPADHPYTNTPQREDELYGETYKQWDYDSLDIECHGGLTFMAPDNGLKKLIPISCDDMWIGFDCGHGDDMCDLEALKKYFGEENYNRKKSFLEAMNNGFYGQSVKYFNYVEKECYSIIEQLIERGIINGKFNDSFFVK